MSNIYKINIKDINNFLSHNNTNKVILFYKQDCVYCKSEINDLNIIANTHKEYEYAIVDITNNIKYCLENNIIKVPTIHIYKDNKLIKQIDERLPIEELETNISGNEKN